MSDIADLLDDTTQAAFREALGGRRAIADEKGATSGADRGAATADHPRPETLAALAVIGRQAVEIRAATLTMLPAGIRIELQAFGFAEQTGANDVRWRLTEEGTRAADALGATVTPTIEERQEARRSLTALLDQVRSELGDID